MSSSNIFVYKTVNSVKLFKLDLGNYFSFGSSAIFEILFLIHYYIIRGSVLWGWEHCMALV